jgi:hypothetical protein
MPFASKYLTFSCANPSATCWPAGMSCCPKNRAVICLSPVMAMTLVSAAEALDMGHAARERAFGVDDQMLRADPERRAVAAPDAGGGQEVHRGRAQKAGDERLAGCCTAPSALPICSTRPSRSTTILSASVIASVWSWVT